MLKTKVILSEVTNLSEARYAAGMGVEHLSFNLDPAGDKYVTADLVKSITEWVSGVSIIGNIGSRPVKNLQDYPLNLVQVSNTHLLEQGKDQILYLKVNEENINSISSVMAENSSVVVFFILSLEENLIHLHNAELSKLCNNFNIYLSTSVNPDSMLEILDALKPQGIVLYGNEEDRPGNTSYDGIAEVLEQLELD